MVRQIALLSLAAAALVAVVFAFVEGPDYYDAYLLLNDVAASTGPSDLKASTPQPKREAHPWFVDGRSDWGDLYTPAEGTAKARLVLVPGLAQGGKDDPRVLAFAEGFARLGFLVLVPEVEGLRELRASPSDAVELADAVIQLTRLRVPGLEPGQSGIAAISYGVGPAILAALDPRAKDKVSFVLAIGGYADMIESVTYVTAGYERDGPGSPWREGTPNIYGRWAFVFANAQRVQSASDRATLKAIAERKFEHPDADISDLTPTLGPEGRAVFALLDNRDPDKVEGLIAQLPQAIQDDLHGLDLARRDLSGLSAQVLLIHGQDDTIIPVTQSKRLAALLPAGRAELFLPEHFMHIEFQQGLSTADMMTLWALGKRLIEFRSDWKPIEAVPMPRPITPVDQG
jgi:pimeloyl-ACP methyl ester carboxylesterase